MVEPYTSKGLAHALSHAQVSDYVRIAADWIARATDWTTEPAVVGNDVVDTLVAAACAHVALRHGTSVPSWTNQRYLERVWHPGPRRFMAWSLAHAPAAFATRGILIEADSLRSV